MRILIACSIMVILNGSFSVEHPVLQDQERSLPQFLYPGFVKGVVLFKNGDSSSSNMNYNMYEEKIVMVMNGSYRYATKLEEIDTVFLEYRKFVPVGKIFYEVLLSAKVSFFIQHKCVYTPLGSSIGYGMKSQSVGPTAFQRFELSGNEVVNIDLPSNIEVNAATVYWVRSNNVMEKFTNERQFLKLFPEKESQLRDFFKKEKPDLKVHDDLIKVGVFLNELPN